MSQQGRDQLALVRCTGESFVEPPQNRVSQQGVASGDPAHPTKPRPLLLSALVDAWDILARGRSRSYCALRGPKPGNRVSRIPH